MDAVKLDPFSRIVNVSWPVPILLLLDIGIGDFEGLTPPFSAVVTGLPKDAKIYNTNDNTFNQQYLIVLKKTAIFQLLLDGPIVPGPPQDQGLGITISSFLYDGRKVVPSLGTPFFPVRTKDGRLTGGDVPDVFELLQQTGPAIGPQTPRSTYGTVRIRATKTDVAYRGVGGVRLH